ncbi:MAG: molybdenum cofactor biosynthesis protein MoaE [Planctomycetota bacterium]|nr:molybdenum cofactor biosynthesis protein MoaE [Planctomycetota bacterium]
MTRRTDHAATNAAVNAAASAGAAIDVALCQGPAAIAALDWPGGCGAENVFVGRTRRERHAEFGELIRLEYECYGPMALKLLDAMARDAATRFGCRAVRIVHAQGRVEPGQASVVIQVATPHRGEAFAACRHLIDRIKHELPIWKREVWERGETFVEGCCAHSHDEKPAADPGARP